MMKFKKLLFIFTIILAGFFGQTFVTQAEDVSNLELDVTTEQEEYSKDDEITYLLTVKNTSSQEAKDVVVTSTLPAEYEVTSEDSNVEGNKVIWNVDSIAGNGQENLTFTAKLKAEAVEDEEPVAPPVDSEITTGNDDSQGTAGNESSAAPKTGDQTNMLGYYALLALSTLVLVVAFRALNKKTVSKGLTFVLILTMLVPAFSAVNAEEVTETVNNTHKLVINNKEYVVNTTVEAVFEIDEEIPDEEYGTLVGKVIDGLTLEPLVGAEISIQLDEETEGGMETAEDGTFEVMLLPGTYTIHAAFPGYLPASASVTIDAAGTIVYDSVLEMIKEENSGIGTASGTITSAVTGLPVAGLNIDIREGKNNVSGDVMETVVTNEAGMYSVELPGGNYTMGISGSGYVTTSKNIVSIGGQTKGEQNASISPEEGIMGDGLRIVLSWGEKPYDLDSHLTGPAADGSRFHVYYSNRYYQDELNKVDLDVDDVSSYGPETVTIIEKVIEGTYTYAIHNYSDRQADNLNLSNSGATVRIYSGAELKATYNVPINKSGNMWKVFEIRNGEIVPINKVEFTTDWSDVDNYLPMS